jgi:hypothetical protein
MARCRACSPAGELDAHRSSRSEEMMVAVGLQPTVIRMGECVAQRRLNGQMCLTHASLPDAAHLKPFSVGWKPTATVIKSLRDC